jgi:GNAT superfamily N-acetyltransferase
MRVRPTPDGCVIEFDEATVVVRGNRQRYGHGPRSILAYHIYSFDVDPPELRSQGYGTAALNAIIGQLYQDGVRQMIAVNVESTAHDFWMRNGFIRTGNSRGDYVRNL